MRLLDGVGRKMGLVCILLSAAGWVCYIVGFSWWDVNVFGNEALDISDNVPVNIPDAPFLDDLDLRYRLHKWFLPYWGFATSGVVLYILASLHLVFGQYYIGLFSNFLATFFLVMGGGVLYLDGFIFDNLLQVEANFFTETTPGRYFIAEFFGCLFAVGFMGFYLMTWSFYTDVNSYTMSCPRCLQPEEGGTAFTTSYTPLTARSMEPVVDCTQQQMQTQLHPQT